MIDTEKLRERIETQSIAAARTIMLRLIRRVARRKIFELAQRAFIVDFNDPLVESTHKNRRDAIISNGAGLADDVAAAADMPALLVIFDQIAPEL